MIHLKCTVVQDANLNSNRINKPYFRTVDYAISFFSFLIYIYFNEALVKNFMREL